MSEMIGLSPTATEWMTTTSKGPKIVKVVKNPSSQIDDDLRRLILSMRSRLKHKPVAEREAIVQSILS